MGEYTCVVIEVWHNWISVEDVPGNHWMTRENRTDVCDGE